MNFFPVGEQLLINVPTAFDLTRWFDARLYRFTEQIYEAAHDLWRGKLTLDDDFPECLPKLNDGLKVHYSNPQVMRGLSEGALVAPRGDGSNPSLFLFHLSSQSVGHASDRIIVASRHAR
jgi:hypothetical protein